MKVLATALTLLFASSAHAWKQPTGKTTVNDVAVKGLTATAAATGALATSAANANADTTTTTIIPALKMDIDPPVLFDIIKDEMNQERILFYGESIKNLFGPAFTFELPSTEFANLKELGLQLLKGSASVIINGQTVGVQVVKSEQGALTVQLQQQYLPKIPFLGLDETATSAAVPTLVAPVPVETVTSTASTTPVQDVVSTAITTATTTTSTTPFWDMPLFDGALRVDVDIPFLFALHKAITPLDVVGTTMAGLGGIYVFTFAYYNYALWQEKQEAIAKQAKMAAKVAARKEKEAAAAAKKVEAAKAEQKLELPEEKMLEDATATAAEEEDKPKRRWLAGSKK
eukprot:CAMPEP_0194029120 /NCGR_PEP_ID=MMETSP0009_2-20130614/2956_1 /TAXON_ID=210454 /ORGANISM="Grammatophora oceanica, Strain CCMP 410" /LENGTH=343 /DNA_ID=CAMNT_0038668717 /DNA_START=64 /DNA_END=1095 /DNA_ORIENTATION=-